MARPLPGAGLFGFCRGRGRGAAPAARRAADAGGACVFRRSRNGLRPTVRACRGVRRAGAGQVRAGGRPAAGPAAEPPKRAQPVCPPGRRAACGRGFPPAKARRFCPFRIFSLPSRPQMCYNIYSTFKEGIKSVCERNQDRVWEYRRLRGSGLRHPQPAGHPAGHPVLCAAASVPKRHHLLSRRAPQGLYAAGDEPRGSRGAGRIDPHHQRGAVPHRPPAGAFRALPQHIGHPQHRRSRRDHQIGVPQKEGGRRCGPPCQPAG